METIVGNAAAAEYVGVSPSTWRAYVARGQAPRPDGTEASKGHALPVWRRATLDEWQAARPGQGRRRRSAA
jgi:predicted DNA-binding transcriptional regulator AlpA